MGPGFLSNDVVAYLETRCVSANDTAAFETTWPGQPVGVMRLVATSVANPASDNKKAAIGALPRSLLSFRLNGAGNEVDRGVHGENRTRVTATRFPFTPRTHGLHYSG